MREIVMDTETTGLDADKGDRIVEIGCVEIVNLLPTSNTFHVYVNPERSMPIEAERIHGLTSDFLKDKPKFAEIADDFLEFIGASPLVIHNASFDMKFLNMELRRCQRPILENDRAVDTLMIARRRFPGAAASLDALCKRFGVDNSNRVLHGALLDSEILADVYLELKGGRQPDFGLKVIAGGQDKAQGPTAKIGPVGARPRPLAPRITDEESVAHDAFVETLGDGAIWSKTKN